ncbi:MAG TPA: PilZ domain-containing protein [Phycisphaerales bacterium]|nr:PilZ domain-containing protein [Phycisphaerales bacterium]
MAGQPSNPQLLRLNEADATAIARALEQHETTAKNLANRNAERFRLPLGFKVVGTFTMPGGSTQNAIVTVRNISRTGMGCLHSTFLHPGSASAMVIVDDQRQPLLRISGKVVRCEQVRVRVFDVGIRFEDSVPLETILPVAAHEESQGEHAELLKHLEAARNALLEGEAGNIDRALTALQMLLNERVDMRKSA